MRRTRVLLAAVTLAVTIAATGGAAVPAGAQVAPTVSVSADPPVAQYTDLSSCGEDPDVQEGAFVFTRDDATIGVSVEYTLGGDAQFGTDFASDPLRLGHVDLLAGETTATIAVEPLASLETGRTLTLTIEPGPDYQVGDPATATIEFLLAVADCAPPVPPVPPAAPQPLAPRFTG